MVDDWYGEASATFGDRLAGAREAAGLSQEDLATQLGVRLETLQAWEEDVLEPRANRLQMLSGMLNVTLMWLLTGSGEGLDGPPEQGEDAKAERALVREIREVRSGLEDLDVRLARLEKRLVAGES
ncbi:transcriptional regulator [Thioclava sediminum]|uniref:Helix-turn-helix transcriptional regulator n=2 Tax=Thioclava TaxID=285107 RepID=A0ABX6YXM4_9RHOB|nr:MULTISPECIES: helix-turn-helix transcriptional regulator [Thioclava]MAQ37788.1 XRE family transcriptional regulator [Thioclava sp.]MAQ39046.1 XRE family transcriptional regulator [Thioclava sp.]MPQ94623.1 helix-turn-helix transcriptional regulator [Thioclava sp. JE_KL1]OOY10242.1 transcriptional regulator [Thioclava sp. F36-7]OOY19621.1 transcriptional regulator [Thioclava sp. DLFJ5-1]|tara:strand:- start:375 stop:752 length:378 start_codon:yes stop_codon:yes gene_type:complete